MDTRAIDGMYELVDHLLTSTSSEQPILQLNSIWGSFEISGYPVIDTLGQRAPQVYLRICWQVPFALKLFHQIPNLQLTQRQEVIALLYATGEPTKTIASQLGLSLYTIKEHVQNIFDRLGIHTRAELIEYTICQAAEPEHKNSEQRQLHWTERTPVNFSRP
jgi:DNA-binding CsgD family transcriptional regulator